MTDRTPRKLTAAQVQRRIDRAESWRAFLASPEFRGAVCGVLLGLALIALYALL